MKRYCDEDVRLLRSAAVTPSSLAAAVTQIGARRTADILFAELHARADLTSFSHADETGWLRLVLTHQDTSFARLIGVNGGTGEPDGVLTQDLLEVATALFGPPAPSTTRTLREVTSPPPHFTRLLHRVIAVLDGTAATERKAS